ncbi:hypothetical protein [Methanoculleus chikugoensis]|uniref:hypothetical protein n=1 Tax=Methanoculleus chikugoensis TaxID=118126 RepID=UPI000A5212ED|nr:hypothetical protein [Methanoculleus chikugoensis]
MRNQVIWGIALTAIGAAIAIIAVLGAPVPPHLQHPAHRDRPRADRMAGARGDHRSDQGVNEA